MGLNNFLEAIFKMQHMGLLRLKIAKYVLRTLRDIGPLRYDQIFDLVNRDIGFIGEKTLRKTLKTLRALKLIRVGYNHNERCFVYELVTFEQFYDSMQSIIKDYHKFLRRELST